MYSTEPVQTYHSVSDGRLSDEEQVDKKQEGPSYWLNLVLC